MSEDNARLIAIEKTLERCITLLEGVETAQQDRAETDRTRWAKLDNLIYGRNGAAGVLVRVDRLEQTAERQKWFIRVLIVKVAALFIAAAWAFLAK
jgi:hypothetical protein